TDRRVTGRSYPQRPIPELKERCHPEPPRSGVSRDPPDASGLRPEASSSWLRWLKRRRWPVRPYGKTDRSFRPCGPDDPGMLPALGTSGVSLAVSMTSFLEVRNDRRHLRKVTTAIARCC